MAENQIIDQFNKSKLEEVLTQFTEFNDQKFLDIRIWYREKEGSELKPSKKGITIKLSLLPDLKNSILKAEDHLKQK